MNDRAASRLAWTLGGLCVLLGIGFVLVVPHVPGYTFEDSLFQAATALTGVAFGCVGALIAGRQRHNAMGWLFLAIGVAMGLTGLVQTYAGNVATEAASLPGGIYADWISNWIWIPAYFLWLPMLMLLFPDGRPISPRWHRVVRVLGAMIVVATVGGMLHPNPGDVKGFHNPVIYLPWARAALSIVVYPLSVFGLIGGIIAGVVGLIMRYRRVGAEQREQLKWFVYAAVATALLFPSRSIWAHGRIMLVAGMFTVLLLPVASLIAITKYRLYDIDVVINKTVVYGALAGSITAVYVAIVVGVGALFGQGDQPNVALSIVATGVIAVAFQPARERAQRFANRLVYGDRATPYEVLKEFSGRMGGAYANEDLLPRMAHVMAEGTGAERAEVWLRIGSSVRLTATWPDNGSASGTTAIPLVDGELPALEGVDRSVAVRHQGELLGAVTVTKAPGDPLGHTEEVLLDDLAGQAGLVLSNVRLTAELEARLDDITVRSIELRASRQRIVAAQDEERRRLERNIHDGAQQHLVALAVKLRLAKALVTRDPAKAAVMLNELREQVGDALDTLSSLALGVYPPLLEEQGIAPALAAQYERSNLPVHLDADVARYPIDVEAAVYFCVLEALQNITKYAAATTIDVSIRDSGDDLTFEVTDNGTGFDPASTPRGSGLNNMNDRLSVLGGDVTIESAPGRGTTVRGRVPLAALEAAR